MPFPAPGVLPGLGIEPRLLQWEADSLPLNHRESPISKVTSEKRDLAVAGPGSHVYNPGGRTNFKLKIRDDPQIVPVFRHSLRACCCRFCLLSVSPQAPAGATAAPEGVGVLLGAGADGPVHAGGGGGQAAGGFLGSPGGRAHCWGADFLTMPCGAVDCSLFREGCEQQARVLVSKAPVLSVA